MEARSYYWVLRWAAGRCAVCEAAGPVSVRYDLLPTSSVGAAAGQRPDPYRGCCAHCRELARAVATPERADRLRAVLTGTVAVDADEPLPTTALDPDGPEEDEALLEATTA